MAFHYYEEAYQVHHMEEDNSKEEAVSDDPLDLQRDEVSIRGWVVVPSVGCRASPYSS